MATARCEVISTIDTVQFSDSTEISPDGNYCVNCCYQLEESNKKREGSILLIQLDGTSARIVTKVSDIDGILDSCWVSANEAVFAGALGNLYFYCHNLPSDLFLRTSVEIDNSSLCLSVDSHLNKIICSTSRGEIVLLNRDFEFLFRRIVHGFEAWVSHLSRFDENLFFSGGDDCRFVGFDLRCNDTSIFSKNFEMGCTSIQSHPNDSRFISTGSYDEKLRIWDLRNMRASVKSFDVGGGVWRHKWCPQGAPLVLVAGMYHGFSVVQTDLNSDYLIELSDLTQKDSLAYGADWVKKNETYCITTCSFYDHRWNFSKLSLK